MPAKDETEPIFLVSFIKDKSDYYRSHLKTEIITVTVEGAFISLRKKDESVMFNSGFCGFKLKEFQSPRRRV